MRSPEFEGLNQLYLCSRCTLDSCLTDRSNIALKKKKKKKRLSLSGPRVRFSKVLVTLWPRKAVIIFIPDGGFKGLKTQPDNKQLKKQNGLVRMPETTTYSNLILKYGFRPV